MLLGCYEKGEKIMSILKEHLKRNCDARMVGVLSLSIREAYRYLMELTERESIFQRAEMKKFGDTFGMDWLMLV